MGSKGSTRHQKRLCAPIVYPIKRKHGTFTIKSYPPRFSKDYSLPLGIIIREILGYANTLREAKKILKKDAVKVDGKVRRSYKFSVGPMDIIEIEETNEYYRLTPYASKRKLILHPIPKDETKWKLLKLTGKRTIRGNKFVLTFHDGRNFIWNDDNHDESISIQDLSPKDSVKYDLENKRILEHYPFEVGSFSVIMGGHNTGISGQIINYEKRYGKNKSLVVIRTKKGDIRTSTEPIFIIGKEQSVIEIPVPSGDETYEYSPE